MLTALSDLAGLAPIVVVDPNGARRTAAMAFGADTTIDPGSADWHEQALALTNSDGYDHVIEASGRPEGLADALELTARAARILVYGVARPGEVTAVQPQPGLCEGADDPRCRVEPVHPRPRGRAAR